MADGSLLCILFDRREWEETKGDNEVDPIRENFDLFGQLTT